MNIHISGNVEGPTAIFLAGWPDTSDVFRTNVMAALAQDYRIVGLTLPGFHQAEPFFQRYRSHQRQRAKEQKDGDANHHPHDDVQRESGLLGQVGAAASRTWQLGRQLLRRGRRLPHHPTHASTSAAAGAALALPTTSAHVEEWFPTGVVGHGFQDLISLLEIAVDTAMETNNYFSPSGAMDGRPILIAHGWGCLLAYELLLCRPTFFARMVALDTGASLYEDRSATYAHASASSSQPSEEARSSTTEPRSLASRYAIRGGGGVKASTSPRPPSNAYKMLVLFVLEAFVLLCMLVVPRRLGQWMLHLFLRAFGRPHYSFDPRHTLRSDTELLNQRLHHHYHLSQNYFDQPTPAAGWHHHHHHNNNRHASMRRGVEQPTLRAELCAAPPGAWSIALIPFLRVEAATDTAPSNGGGGGGGFDERGHRVAARYPKSTHAGRRRRCMAGEFRDSSDDVEDLIHDGSGPDSPRRQSSAITTIYRGYAKAEESADLSGLSHVSPYRSIREAAGATCPSSATQQNARFSPAQFRLKKHAVFYKSYYFPPAPRRGVAGEEEATTTVNAAACVVADPAWGWLFLQFWMGVVLSFVFSDRDSNNNNNNTNTAAAAASAPATAPAASSHHAAHHRSSHHSAHATMRQSRFAPLVTMRYAVPIPIPILFMYGGRKMAMLHSTQWCEYIHTTKRGADGISDVVEMPHGGHWFFAEPTCQALVCQRIIDFLRAPSLPQGA